MDNKTILEKQKKLLQEVEFLAIKFSQNVGKNVKNKEE